MNGKMLSATKLAPSLKGKEGALVDAITQCEATLVLRSDALWDAPEWVIDLDGNAPSAAEKCLLAAAQLPGVSSPASEGVERPVQRLGILFEKQKLAGVWFETSGRKPVRTYQPKRRLETIRHQPYKNGVLGVEGLDGALAALHARHSLDAISWHGAAIEFTLGNALPLTNFLRLDIAVPFENRAPEIAARIPELAVRGFGLRGGAMTLLLS
jgi:hypothetical protein